MPVSRSSPARGEAGGRAVGAVDVEPQALALGEVGEVGERIDRAGARRARRPDDRERLQAGLAVERAARRRPRPAAAGSAGSARRTRRLAGLKPRMRHALHDRGVRVLRRRRRWPGRGRRRGRGAAAASAVSVPTDPPLTSTPSVVSGIPIQSRSQSSVASSIAEAPAPPVQLPAKALWPVPIRSARTRDRVARAADAGEEPRVVGALAAREDLVEERVDGLVADRSGRRGRGRCVLANAGSARRDRRLLVERLPAVHQPVPDVVAERRSSSGGRLSGSTAATIGRCAPP